MYYYRYFYGIVELFCARHYSSMRKIEMALSQMFLCHFPKLYPRVAGYQPKWPAQVLLCCFYGPSTLGGSRPRHRKRAEVQGSLGLLSAKAHFSYHCIPTEAMPPGC